MADKEEEAAKVEDTPDEELDFGDDELPAAAADHDSGDDLADEGGAPEGVKAEAAMDEVEGDGLAGADGEAGEGTGVEEAEAGAEGEAAEDAHAGTGGSPSLKDVVTQAMEEKTVRGSGGRERGGRARAEAVPAREVLRGGRKAGAYTRSLLSST